MLIRRFLPFIYLASWLLLVAGFYGPWVYGPLGKSADFGWQPVWGLLLHLLPVNIFVVLSVVDCYCYLELAYRRNERVIVSVLRWVGAFLGLLALPLLWFIFDQTGRGRTPLLEDGTLGWGAWLALTGLIIQIIALRVNIKLVKEKRNLS